MKLTSESEEPQFSVLSVIEGFNADIQAAASNGLCIDEIVALIGAISQSGLRAIPKSERRLAWKIMVDIMNKRFEDGEL